ncbi:MAG: twin-arginine translocation signal domain-containing protein, partial [Terracidiphilus sp.]
MKQRHRPKHPRASDNLTRRRFLQTSTAALAGATLLPPLALADSQSADAVLPAGMSLNWDKLGIETVNAK